MSTPGDTGPLTLPGSTPAQSYYLPALQHAILSREHERQLLTQAQAGDRPALDTLIRHNQRLVYKESRRAFERGLAGDLDLLDLVQFGNLGLLYAIRKFDLTLPHKLSTYAVPWIRLYIERGGRAYGHLLDVGINKSLHLARVRRAAVAYYQRYERWPTPEELVPLTGLSPALVQEALAYDTTAVYSLDTHAGGSPDAPIPLLEVLPDDTPDTDTLALANLQAEAMLTALEALPPDLRQVLELRYGLNGYAGKPHNYREIGLLIGCSRTWAQKLETDALELLRAVIDPPEEPLNKTIPLP